MRPLNPPFQYKLNYWDPALPEHKCDNRGGLITLAGDAAHPMTFQRGQGLNHAVTDSVKLCKAIVDCWHSSEGFQSERAAAIDGYEKEMIARASERARKCGSARRIRKCCMIGSRSCKVLI